MDNFNIVDQMNRLNVGIESKQSGQICDEMEVSISNKDSNHLKKEKKLQSNKKQSSKQAKKERKLIQVFTQKLLFPKLSPELVAELNWKTQDSPNETNIRNILLDNRDYQVCLPTENLLNLIIDELNLNVEDIFVIPQKTWILIRFGSGDDLAIFKEYIALPECSSIGKQCAPLSDQIYNLTVEAFLPEVMELISTFGNIELGGRQLPPGLKLEPEFITVQEEESLFQFAEKCFKSSLENSSQISRLKNRSSVHFGHVFDYTRNSISSEGSISVLDSKLPEEVRFLFDRLRSLIPEVPDQLTINRYVRDNHIPAHVDTHSMCTEWILSVSVHSDVVMFFSADGTASRGKHEEEALKISLPRRSALVMGDEARYHWRHAIPQTAVDIRPLRLLPSTDTTITPYSTTIPSSRLSLCPRDLRYSFTFRKVRPTGYRCQCQYPETCDSQKPKSPDLPEEEEGPITPTRAIQLEREFVHQTYDEIASHFSATRYGQWPLVVDFLSSLPSGSMILDVGCGNGKYLSVQPERLFFLGSDRSKNLLNICGERGFEVFQDDCLTIGRTMREGMFDAVICIAVIHHLATEERRLEAIRSIVRLLVRGGRALIYVWAFEQRKGGAASKYLKESKNPETQGKTETETTEEIRVHTNRTEFKQQDLFVPWKKANQNKKQEKEELTQEPDSTKLRFYHVFRDGELEALLSKLEDEIQLEQIYYDQGNWCAIFHKN